MKLEKRLDGISDDVLLERLTVLVKRQNALTAAVLAHIGEVDRRRLYLREACSSMHRYCVERLGLSDGAAYKRIHAARAARRFPVLLTMVERGELHLKGITLLAPHLTEVSQREVLERARHQPVRAIEKLVAELAPSPDVSSRLRALPPDPSQKAPTQPTISEQPKTPVQPPAAAHPPDQTPSIRPAPERSLVAPGPVSTPSARKPVSPLAPRRYELRITIDEATHADLAQLQDLLGHQVPDRDLAAIVSRALALLLERTLSRKAAVTDRPRVDGPQRAPKSDRATEPGASKPNVTAEAQDAGEPAKRSRYIPADVRRTVWSRDGRRCAFRDSRGRRCTATSQLEFHHIDNFARGAEHDPDRMELRCRAHNLYQAKLDYGEAFIEAARSGKTGAHEPSATYRPGGDRPPAVGCALRELEQENTLFSPRTRWDRGGGMSAPSLRGNSTGLEDDLGSPVVAAEHQSLQTCFGGRRSARRSFASD